MVRAMAHVRLVRGAGGGVEAVEIVELLRARRVYMREVSGGSAVDGVVSRAVDVGVGIVRVRWEVRVWVRLRVGWV